MIVDNTAGEVNHIIDLLGKLILKVLKKEEDKETINYGEED